MQIYSHTLQSLSEWTIQLGMTRRHSHAHYGQKIKVKKVIPHPQYSQYVAHDNDIALFQVIEKLKRLKFSLSRKRFNVS
jgi:atrial natriuretic peptide-converting enzyme